jgi:small subunit ribosomal protein S36
VRLRPPRLVVAATATFGTLTAFWSVLTPLTEAPDEPAHLGLVLEVAHTGHYPAYDELQHTEGLFQLCIDFAASTTWCHTEEERTANLVVRDHPAGEAPPKDRRPRWDDPDFRALEPDRMNQMPQHPPLYYQLMAAGLRVERWLVPGELSVDTELAYLRLLNVLLVLPLPWVAWLTARRLRVVEPVGLVAALVPLAVPQLTHIGATLNNDNLFVVLVSALMAALAGVARGDRSVRTVALVGAVLGLALLTKGFGVVLPPIVALAYWIGSASPSPGTPTRLLRRVRTASGPALGALLLGLVVSGWWYVGNLTATGRIMPSTEDSLRLNPRSRPTEFEPDVGEYLGSTVSRLVEGFWGAFGWRQVELPTVVSAAASLLCLATVVLPFRQGPSTSRPTLALLLSPLVLLAAFVVVRSAVIYSGTGRLAFQQGRYLFGGLTAASVVVAIGLHHRFRRRAVPLAALAVVTMQALAITWCLAGWWDATDVGLIGALRAVVAWSGWPDPVVVAILAMTPLPLAVFGAEVVRQALVSRPRSPTGSVPDPTMAAADRAGTPASIGSTARTRPPAAARAAGSSAPGSRTGASESRPPGS